MASIQLAKIPSTFDGIGYRRPRDSLPLEVIEVPVPRPALDSGVRSFLRFGLGLAMEWAVKDLVTPHVGKTINSTAAEINDELRAMKRGSGLIGKVAVVVDRNRGTGV
jgi:hypothetical protein